MKKHSRRYALLFLAALGFGMFSVASAVNLGINENNTLGSGVSVTSSCQPSGGNAISVGFGDLSFLTNTANYVLNSVNLQNIAAACNGKTIKVTVLDASNTVLASYSGIVGSTSLTATLSSSVAVPNVGSVAVVIY